MMAWFFKVACIHLLVNNTYIVDYYIARVDFNYTLLWTPAISKVSLILQI